MKVLILTLGTRDIQPFVALASESTRAGHEAVLLIGQSVQRGPSRLTPFLTKTFRWSSAQPRSLS